MKKNELAILIQKEIARIGSGLVVCTAEDAIFMIRRILDDDARKSSPGFNPDDEHGGYSLT
jgi:hypothetical protein